MGFKLGRALGHFIFSPFGPKRILFIDIFFKALQAPPSQGFREGGNVPHMGMIDVGVGKNQSDSLGLLVIMLL